MWPLFVVIRCQLDAPRVRPFPDVGGSRPPCPAGCLLDGGGVRCLPVSGGRARMPRVCLLDRCGVRCLPDGGGITPACPASVPSRRRGHLSGSSGRAPRLSLPVRGTCRDQLDAPRVCPFRCGALVGIIRTRPASVPSRRRGTCRD